MLIREFLIELFNLSAGVQWPLGLSARQHPNADSFAIASWLIS